MSATKKAIDELCAHLIKEYGEEFLAGLIVQHAEVSAALKESMPEAKAKVEAEKADAAVKQ